jgi:hypothetical protein
VTCVPWILGVCGHMVGGRPSCRRRRCSGAVAPIWTSHNVSRFPLTTGHLPTSLFHLMSLVKHINFYILGCHSLFGRQTFTKFKVGKYSEDCTRISVHLKELRIHQAGQCSLLKTVCNKALSKVDPRYLDNYCFIR